MRAVQYFADDFAAQKFRYSYKVSMMVQDVRSGEVCRDPAVLLKYSVQVLSSLLRQEKHLQFSVVDLDNIAKRFSLLIPDPAERGRPYVLARIQHAGASCRSALQLRYQLAPGIPNDILHRDNVLRLKQQQHLQLLNPHDGSFGEAQLERKLLDSPPGCLGTFPYLFAREWTPADGGKGDLVFTDGHSLFAVVEVKHINMSISKNSRRRKRSLVRAQAQKYGQAFATEHPNADVVIAGVYTELVNTVVWVPLHNQKIKRVRMLVQEAAAVKAKPGIVHSSNDMSSASSQAASRQADTLLSQARWPSRVCTVQSGTANPHDQPNLAHTTVLPSTNAHLSERKLAAQSGQQLEHDALPVTWWQVAVLAGAFVGCCAVGAVGNVLFSRRARRN